MPAQIDTMFQASPTRMVTTVLDQTYNPLTGAALSAMGFSSFTSPAKASGSASVIPTSARKSVTFYNPSNGILHWLGRSPNVSPTNGLEIYPGGQLTISGPITDVYMLSSGVASTIYFATT